MDASAYNSYKRSSAANVINSMLPRAPNSIPPSTRPLPPSRSRPPPLLCGRPLFTAFKRGRVNYGGAGFHKSRDEIWSDKFNSQDPAPGSRRPQVTRARARAHKYDRASDYRSYADFLLR